MAPAPRIAARLLGCCALAGASVLPLHAADPVRDRGENVPCVAPYTAAPVSVDGALDEAIWQEAGTLLVRYATHPKEDDLSPEATVMTVRFAWDHFYFYIGYTWHDTNVTALPSERVEGPMTNMRQGAVVWNDQVPVDLAEFFLAPVAPKHYWELHHNALNAFNDINITVLDPDDPARNSDNGRWGILFHDGDYVQDDGAHTFASAVQMSPTPGADGKPGRSTINQATDTDTGYSAEIRVPWRSIGPWDKRAPDTDRSRLPMPWHMGGVSFRALVVAQQPDLPGRGYYHSSPDFQGGWFHHGYAQWNTIQLGAEPPATPATK